MPALKPVIRRSAVLTAATLAGGLLTSVSSPPTSALAAATQRTCSAPVSVYGALSDGRLTYSAIDPATGNRTRTVVSTAKLGFVPKAMATLNYNTVLVTKPDNGVLHRIDVRTNTVANGLTYAVTAIEDGWSHDQLTYDGHGHLYGTAGGKLLQYAVTRSKPWAAAIGQRKEIGTGFTLKTLASSGDDRLYATANDGTLIEYTISSSGSWSRKNLATKWGAFTQLVSPHGGLIYARTQAGAMYWYEHSGSTVTYHTDDPVDTGGWTQTILSAQPATCTDSTGGGAPRANPHGPSETDGTELTPRAEWVEQEIHRAFSGTFDCFTYDSPDSSSDHATGNAIDCAPGKIGDAPSSSQKEAGDDLAEWLKRYAEDLDVSYIIWYGRIWNQARASEGWRSYCHSGLTAAQCANPTTADEIRLQHYDHVHVSVL